MLVDRRGSSARVAGRTSTVGPAAASVPHAPTVATSRGRMLVDRRVGARRGWPGGRPRSGPQQQAFPTREQWLLRVGACWWIVVGARRGWPGGRPRSGPQQQAFPTRQQWLLRVGACWWIVAWELGAGGRADVHG